MGVCDTDTFTTRPQPCAIIRGYAATTYRSLVIQESSTGSLLLEDSEVFAQVPSYTIDGVRGSNLTVRGVAIHDVVDGVRITGNNVRIEASWIHDNLHYTSIPAPISPK